MHNKSYATVGISIEVMLMNEMDRSVAWSLQLGWKRNKNTVLWSHGIFYFTLNPHTHNIFGIWFAGHFFNSIYICFIWCSISCLKCLTSSDCWFPSPSVFADIFCYHGTEALQVSANTHRFFSFSGNRAACCVKYSFSIEVNKLHYGALTAATCCNMNNKYIERVWERCIFETIRNNYYYYYSCSMCNEK